MLRGRIWDTLPCRRTATGTAGPRRELSNEGARLWLKRGLNCFPVMVFSLDRVAGSVLDRGRSEFCSKSLPLLRRRWCVDDKLPSWTVRARRSCLSELGPSFLISPFLSEAQNALSLSSITCSVVKSLVLPSDGNSHSCSCAGSPYDPLMRDRLAHLEVILN